MNEPTRWNIEALRYLLSDGVSWIEDSARKTGISYGAATGVARQVVGQGVDSLQPGQTRVFDRALRPLIERVPCEGPIGMVTDDESSCVHGGSIDDQSLVRAYEEDDFVCQNCRHDRDKLG